MGVISASHTNPHLIIRVCKWKHSYKPWSKYAHCVPAPRASSSMKNHQPSAALHTGEGWHQVRDKGRVDHHSPRPGRQPSAAKSFMRWSNPPQALPESCHTSTNSSPNTHAQFTRARTHNFWVLCNSLCLSVRPATISISCQSVYYCPKHFLKMHILS